MKDLIGMFSSLVLLVTVGSQVWKQWRSGSSGGVSPGLFAGQITASVGFTTYSWMVSDWVFVATNSFMLFIALLGVAITLTHQRRARAVAVGTLAPGLPTRATLTAPHRARVPARPAHQPVVPAARLRRMPAGSGRRPSVAR